MNSAEAAFHEPGLWSSVWKLMRMRLVIQVSGFRRAKLRTKIGYILLGLLLLIFLGFVFFISFTLLTFLRSPDLAKYIGGDTSALIDGVPGLLVSVSAAGILATGFGVLLQALYLSGDMDFLMSSPIPIRAVFIAKMVQAVLPNFGIMCLFTLPILYGLGISDGYNFLYYPFVLLVLVMIALAASALASLLVMVAARFFAVRRMAEVLGFVVGTFFLVFSQTARFLRFDVSQSQVSSLLNLTARFNQPWSPLAWAGMGLVDLGKGIWLPAIGLLAISFLLTGGIFYAALTISERMYFTGWSGLQASGGNRRRLKVRRPAQAPAAVQVRGASLLTAGVGAGPLPAGVGANPFVALVPAPIRAILLKDMLVYRRDLRNLSQLITPLILGVVYAIGLLQGGGKGFAGAGEAPGWFLNAINSVIVYADVALALFLGWMLVARLAGLGFSHEGKNYWMLKAAPISARTLLTAKFLVGYLPALLLCLVYELVLQVLKGASLWSAVMSLLAVALTLAGLTGIYLAFGASGAKFDWEHPAQMNRSVGCLGQIAGMIFLPICFGLFILPPLLAGLVGAPLFIGQLVGLVLGGSASIAGVIIPLGLVEKRVAMLNE